MNKSDIINHFKDANKSFLSKNYSFILSLYAGYEYLMKDSYYNHKPTKKYNIFYNTYPKDEKFMLIVGDRLTSYYNINMKYIKNINNRSKHTERVREIEKNLNEKPGRIWNEYFSVMNKLISILEKEYNYDLGFKFESPIFNKHNTKKSKINIKPIITKQELLIKELIGDLFSQQYLLRLYESQNSISLSDIKFEYPLTLIGYVSMLHVKLWIIENIEVRFSNRSNKKKEVKNLERELVNNYNEIYQTSSKREQENILKNIDILTENNLKKILSEIQHFSDDN